MITNTLIQRIEETSMRALPALTTRSYDGWILRFANGYTRRANSISPIYASGMDLDEKLHHCHAVYHQAGLPLIFKMTRAPHPDDLDNQLEERHFDRSTATAVKTLDLQPYSPVETPNVTVDQRFTVQWFDAYAAHNKLTPNHQHILNHILRVIVPQTGYAMLTQNGKIVAVGLGVIDNGLLGIFDIVVAESQRGNGHGREIVESLLAWGKSNSAQTAYLQVMQNNTPALKLYEKLGFEEVYEYWYRSKS